MGLQQDVVAAINRNSAENGSDTPDLILGQYLLDCLVAFNKASRARDEWHGFTPWRPRTETEVT